MGREESACQNSLVRRRRLLSRARLSRRRDTRSVSNRFRRSTIACSSLVSVGDAIKGPVVPKISQFKGPPSSRLRLTRSREAIDLTLTQSSAASTRCVACVRIAGTLGVPRRAAARPSSTFPAIRSFPAQARLIIRLNRDWKVVSNRWFAVYRGGIDDKRVCSIHRGFLAYEVIAKVG